MTQVRRSGRVAVLMLLSALASATALAQPRPYRGAHPIDLEGNWHVDEDVHVHDTLPVGLAGFGEVDGVLVFLADPTAFGWTGALWSFSGAHPLAGGISGYCGMRGVHEHTFAPEGAYQRGSDGVYTYNGALRGGLDVVTPGRPVPPHPVTVISASQRAAYWGGSPFFFNGCMHQVVIGPRGGFSRLPLPGCAPQVFAPPPVATATPPMQPVWTPRFEGPAFQTRPLAPRVDIRRGDGAQRR